MSKKLFVSKFGVTKQQLIMVMIYHLENFNDEKIVIDKKTLHKSILSDTDGVTSSSSSKSMYKGIIRWTLQKNGHKDNAWPSNWLELSVEDLASKII